MVTLDSVCSGHIYAEDKEHLTLYLASFDLGENAQRFLFPVLEPAALAVCICCGSELMNVSMAAWTEVGIPVLGRIALVWIAGFTSSKPSSLRNFSLVIKVFRYFFRYSRSAFRTQTFLICINRTNGHLFEIL